MRTLVLALSIPIVGLAGMVGGCKTSAQLETSAPAQIASLDQDFQVTSRLGASPITFDKNQPVQRLAVFPPGRSPEYLVVVTPNLANGALKFPIQESKDVVESAVEYNRYLDLLLRAHRMILRGDIEDGEKALDKLEGLFDKTFGSLVLRSNIAILKDDKEKAAQLLTLANMLYPGASIYGGKAKP